MLGDGEKLISDTWGLSQVFLKVAGDQEMLKSHLHRPLSSGPSWKGVLVVINRTPHPELARKHSSSRKCAAVASVTKTGAAEVAEMPHFLFWKEDKGLKDQLISFSEPLCAALLGRGPGNDAW